MTKRTRKKKPQKKYRDWYEIKCKQWEQDMLDELANSRRQTKAEKRKVSRNEDPRKGDNIGAAMGYAINTLNYIVDGDFSFHGDRHGRTITAIHHGLGEEAVYMRLYTCPVTDEKSVFRTLKDTLLKEDELIKEYSLKELRQEQINLNTDRGWWHHTDSIFSPQLCFKDGGAVTVGSDRLHDCVDARVGGENCLITKQEHIVAAPEIAGLGFGSYALGHHFLFVLRNYWRHRGKKYAKRR